MFMTKKQLQIVEFIRDYRRSNRVSPTLDELANHFSVSRITIFEHIESLTRKGILKKTRNHARSIEIIAPEFRDLEGDDSTLPILGTVAAGRPIEAVEEPEPFSLRDMLPSREGTFLLRVEGNSMIDEQIRDGDLVLVERRQTPTNGETVVAVIEGEEVTLKKFYRERGGRIRLQPANPDMAPIYPEEVEIRGVVIGIIRRY